MEIVGGCILVAFVGFMLYIGGYLLEIRGMNPILAYSMIPLAFIGLSLLSGFLCWCIRDKKEGKG